MNSQSLVRVTVLILVLGAAGLVSRTGYAQGPPPGGFEGPPPGEFGHRGPPPGMRGPGPPIGPLPWELEQIGLSEKQREAFDALRADEWKEVMRIDRRMRQATGELDDLLATAHPDEQAVEDLVTRLATLHTAKLEARITTVIGLNAKLTQDQRRQLKRLREARATYEPGAGGGGSGTSR